MVKKLQRDPDKFGETKSEPLRLLVLKENKKHNDEAREVLYRIIEKKYCGKKCLKNYLKVYKLLYYEKKSIEDISRIMKTHLRTIYRLREKFVEEGRLWQEEIRKLI